MPRAGRVQDEKLLNMIKFRASGKSLGDLGGAFGMSTASASIQTNKVMDADVSESGEPPEVVALHYWPRQPK